MVSTKFASNLLSQNRISSDDLSEAAVSSLARCLIASIHNQCPSMDSTMDSRVTCCMGLPGPYPLSMKTSGPLVTLWLSL